LSQNKGGGFPWWAKAVIIGGVAIGGIVAAAEVIYNVVTAPVNTYKALLDKQYQEFLEKINRYTTSNPNGYTTAQQQSISYETTIMGQTAQGLANTSKSLTDLGAAAINDFYILAGVLGGVFVGLYAVARFVIPALRSKLGAPIKTAQAMNYAAIMTFAENLAENGYPTEAANILVSARSTFQSYDQPVMQQAISSLNAVIPTLTGIELILAEQQVEALNLEMAMIPQWLVLPLPIV
jgi:hypothetical protein